jgi:hypothetical protein
MHVRGKQSLCMGNWNLIINIHADIIILRYGAIYCNLQAKFVLKSTAKVQKVPAFFTKRATPPISLRNRTIKSYNC